MCWQNLLRVRLLWLALLGVALPVSAAEELVIGYLEIDGDPRYRETHTFARYLAQPLGRPYPAAEVARKEARFPLAAVGLALSLRRAAADDAAGLAELVRVMRAEGVRYFVVDAPAAVVAALAAATRDDGVLLFNVSASDDLLRGEACQPHLMHVLPSDAMASDALAQFLVSRKWREVLVLHGEGEQDERMRASFERAARRYGLRLVEQRPFVLSNDPRERERNNIALLTAGVDHDVVFVADSHGEFARNVPYHTTRPRPVVGSEGLAALAWHWSWERHGAPQLERRFKKQAERPMRGIDWAAWMAVKAVAEAAVRSGGAEFEPLVGDEIILDGFKGNRVNFRTWDNQLRQPMLLATHNWVVERAPIRGFLHPTNNLDTLGIDERDSRCEF